MPYADLCRSGHATTWTERRDDPPAAVYTPYFRAKTKILHQYRVGRKFQHVIFNSCGLFESGVTIYCNSESEMRDVLGNYRRVTERV